MFFYVESRERNIMAEKKKSFEQNMKRLAEIVDSLENSEAGLEDLLKLFEEGTELIRNCSKMLDKAEQEVYKLTVEKDGAVREEPFDESLNEE